MVVWCESWQPLGDYIHLLALYIPTLKSSSKRSIRNLPMSDCLYHLKCSTLTFILIPMCLELYARLSLKM